MDYVLDLDTIIRIGLIIWVLYIIKKNKQDQKDARKLNSFSRGM